MPPDGTWERVPTETAGISLRYRSVTRWANCRRVLAWNRKITDSNPGSTFTPSPSLDNLNLGLYEADGFSVGTLLDQSVSSVDNVEHIYINADLGIGEHVSARALRLAGFRAGSGC